MIFEDIDSTIEWIQSQLGEIQKIPDKEERQERLLEILTFLISETRKTIKKQELLKASEFLRSAIYIMEEYFPAETEDLLNELISIYVEQFKKEILNGSFQEAANIAINIADLYGSKMGNHEKENEYIRKAAELIENQIEILKDLGTPHELAVKYQIVSGLYKRLNDIPKAMDAAKKALEYAKQNNAYSIISNAYSIIVDCYINKNMPGKAENVLCKAIDYFSKETSKYENTDQYLPLSELYQILKKLYKELRNPNKYKIYSRKEANIYISMAKLSQLYESGEDQTASYYRAAGLCYQETGQNYLDGATCFLLAASHYERANRDVEAGLNYEDAAHCFEKIGNYKKAYEYFLKAAEKAEKIKNLDVAIDNLIWAYEIASQEGYEKKQLVLKIHEAFDQLANLHHSMENYFGAATLLIEALYFKTKTDSAGKESIKNECGRILDELLMAMDDPIIKKPSLQALYYTLLILIAKMLGNEKLFGTTLKTLKALSGKKARKYRMLLDEILPAITEGNIIEIERLSEHNKKLLAKVEEIGSILKIWNKYHEPDSKNRQL